MKMRLSAVFVALAVGVVSASQAEEGAHDSAGSIEFGRHLVKISGCNDCHTPGYSMSSGRVLEKNWLIGDSLGWRGPWGTTYAHNLRLIAASMDEEQWVRYARALKPKPPMPDTVFVAMKEVELRSIFKFIRSLGSAGVPAPAYLPPNVEPPQPYVLFPSPPPPVE
ncbi:MAG: cytochrome C [Verrucomicrobia bacterium]|nr:cytochrome C [Kiritimatiellia bacterium]MCO6399731.1 cytochrome C [Verrucomicrobiota bacterium]